MKFSIIVICLIVLVLTIGIITHIMTTPYLCIDGEDAPNWLGSETGCGPQLIYEFQKFFGILW